MSLACSDLKRVQGSEKSSVRRDLGKRKCAGFETNTRIKFYHRLRLRHNKYGTGTKLILFSHSYLLIDYGALLKIFWKAEIFILIYFL